MSKYKKMQLLQDFLEDNDYFSPIEVEKEVYDYQLKQKVKKTVTVKRNLEVFLLSKKTNRYKRLRLREILPLEFKDKVFHYSLTNDAPGYSKNYILIFGQSIEELTEKYEIRTEGKEYK